ncbi:MAG: DUF4010 domain-containing protein [Parvularculaceae bacterium]
MLTGVIGGLASSTATTLSLSRFVKDGADARDIAAGVITANVVMLIRVGFLLAAVSRQILSAVWPALLAGALAGAAAAWLLWRAAGGSSGEDRTIKLGNPMEIRPALFFAAILAAVSLASSFGAEQFGSAGLFIVGLISGLADVDAITLTAGRHAAGVGAAAAGAAVMAAVAANMVTKAAMAWSIGGRRLGSIVAGAFAAVIGVGAAVLFFI